MNRKRLLIVSSRFPFPIEKGDKLRLYHQIKVLSGHYEIHLFSVNHIKPTDNHFKELEPYCKSIACYKLNPVILAVNLLKSIFTKEAFQVSYFYDQYAQKALYKQIELIKPDHIYCQLIRAAKYVKDLKFSKTIDYMDAFSYGMNQRAKHSRGVRSFFYNREAKLLSKYEDKLANHFENKTIISAQDKKRLKSINDLTVVHNGVGERFLEPIPNLPPKFEFGFVGNLGYFPNAKAVKFLIDKIRPCLQEKGDYKVAIFGARASTELLRLSKKDLNIVGWVDDIKDAYTSIKVLLVPIFGGIGQQNKVLEAMAMGVACVVSPEVALGINARNGIELLVSESPEEFVENGIKLLKDNYLYQTITENARCFIEDNFTWKRSTQALIDLIDKD